MPIDWKTRRMDFDPDDEAGIETLRATCPARQTETDLDIEVARRLLEDPDLFARVLGSREPKNATRVETSQSSVTHGAN